MSEKVIHKIFYLLYLLIAGGIIGTGVSYLQTYLSDYSDYFNYISVEPEKTEYESGEPVFFISTLYRKRPLSMEFNDILYCKNGVDKRYSSSKTYFMTSIMV
jgi:hypothetical protein